MKKFQIPKIKILLPIFFIALLFLTPFLSTSMMSSYILNILIVFLVLEAGFLSSNSKSLDESEKHNIFTTIEATYVTTLLPPIVLIKRIAKREKAKKDALKRCKSRPSIFFIGSEELEYVEKKEDIVIIAKEVEAKIPMKGVGKEEEISKHELYMMTEAFIGNFYKQLKIDVEGEIFGEVIA